MAIWDMLHEMNIEVPFPQRDLHIKSAPDGLKMVSETRAEPLSTAGESNSREE